MTRGALRIFLYIVGAALVGIGALLVHAGCGRFAAPPLGAGLVLLIGLAVEHWRYQPLADRSPGPGWVATDERFVDPETGKLVRVYHQPATGERRYVAQ